MAQNDTKNVKKAAQLTAEDLSFRRKIAAKVRISRRTPRGGKAIRGLWRA